MKNKKIKRCHFQTSVRPSQFIKDFDNPTKKELLFMYEWLYNWNHNRGDFERCQELKIKYEAIKKSDQIKTYTIKGGIPALIGVVASQIPTINYSIDSTGQKNFFNNNKGLSVNESLEVWEEVKKGGLKNEK